MELYIAWMPGLDEDEQALAALKQSGVIQGIEMSTLCGSREKIQKSGLKVSLHNPRIDHSDAPNLANAELMSMFDGPAGQTLLSEIQKTDSPYVGYHCGYAAEKVFKMNGFPDVPRENSLIQEGSELNRRMIKHLKWLHETINSNLHEQTGKRLLLESLDYSRDHQIVWERQSPAACANRKTIESMVELFGINAAYQFVTDPDFILSLLNQLKHTLSPAPGFLLDIAHLMISADAMHHQGLIAGVDDFLSDTFEKLGPWTRQIHVNVPEGDVYNGFSDGHGRLIPGQPLSDEMMILIQRVLQHCPEADVITLEMANMKSKLPVYVDDMIDQAVLIQNMIMKR